MIEVSRDELELTDAVGLDFVNTIVPARRGPIDLLHHPDCFEWWMAQAMSGPLAGLMPPDPPGRRLLTVEARSLRAALVALFRTVAAGRRRLPTSAHASIDRALRAATVTHRLDGIELVAHFGSSSPLLPLTPIAVSALTTAREARPERLRECAAEDCSRWFVDTSKGGRRRWCSMERCGNRAKAARYRKRHA